MEILSYEFCKLTICDPYLKRYLKSYVAAALVIISFEIMVDQVIEDTEHKLKVDLSHIQALHKIMQKVFSKLFGYNKYLFCQLLGNMLMNRFRCFFFQYSGILLQ
jgi:hypothetical protein